MASGATALGSVTSGSVGLRRASGATALGSEETLRIILTAYF